MKLEDGPVVQNQGGNPVQHRSGSGALPNSGTQNQPNQNNVRRGRIRGRHNDGQNQVQSQQNQVLEQGGPTNTPRPPPPPEPIPLEEAAKLVSRFNLSFLLTCMFKLSDG